MKQLSIFDLIAATNPVNDELFEIIKAYLLNHGSDSEYFRYEFDHYSQILNENTKIAISNISDRAPCCAVLHLFNGNTIQNIRLFSDNCIIEEDNSNSNNYDVLYEVLFRNYNEQKHNRNMNRFSEWYKNNSNVHSGHNLYTA